MLNITQTTKDGRFTVTIVSRGLDAERLSPTDVVKSLEQLSRILVDAADTAVNLGLQILQVKARETTDALATTDQPRGGQR